jgi:outer membrane protein OmpA-like peptidoglycan-associated protein
MTSRLLQSLSVAVLCSLGFAGTLSADVPGEAPEGPAEKVPPKLPPLKVVLDRSSVDLDKHQFVVRLSREADRVELSVLDEYGAPIAEEEIDFKGRRAGSPLRITWRPTSDDPVAKIELTCWDKFGYYAGIRLVPWSLFIPHEEVNFATNSADIEASEEPKLEASLKEILAGVEAHKDLGSISLFIAGHTDTRGTAQHNQELSRRRARSIAVWFKSRGLTLPVHYAGFGESAPLVKTEDEVDEPKNRRVDYVLSVESPRFKHSNRHPNWARL